MREIKSENPLNLLSEVSQRGHDSEDSAKSHDFSSDNTKELD